MFVSGGWSAGFVSGLVIRFEPMMFSGAVFMISSTSNPFVFGGTSWGNIQDERGDVQSTFNPTLQIFRQSPEPINEMEKVKADVERMLRAEHLLKDILGEGRYKDFVQTHQITIPSKLHKDRYYIVREWGRVEVVENGITTDELCLVSTQTLAEQDVIALKKLLLENDEKRFLEVANHFPREPEERVEEMSPVRASFWRRFGRR